MRSRITGVFAAAAVTVVASCQTNERPNEVARGTLGESVNSICFTRQINDWQPLGDRALILQHGLDDYYRVELIGTCDVRDAFLNLQVETRAGSCLNTGDEVRFNNRPGEVCSVGDMHRWHVPDIPGL